MHDASLAKSESATIFVSGTLDDVVSIVEQLAWFAASFRPSVSEELTMSSVSFKNLVHVEPADHISQQKRATFELQLDTLESIELDDDLEGMISPTCWQELFQGGILASGFPIAPREEGLGLEIPFELMILLSQARLSMTHDLGTILFGHSTCLFPAKKLQDGVQWHLVKSSDSELLRDCLDNLRGRIYEDKISIMASRRTFLGYHHAHVLLGTRKLIEKSSASTSGFDTSSSKIEIAREGTTSAGLSIKSIFNLVVAGKWTMHKGLQVNMTGNRTYSDRLDNSSRRPILLYDRRTRSAWLVSELSLILHMVLTYLDRSKIRRRRCNQEGYQINEWPQLPSAEACSDGGAAAHKVICEHRDLYLYTNENKEERYLWNEVDDFLKDLGSIRQAENLRKATSGWQISSSRPQGWDFVDFVEKDEEICQREMPKNDNRASWWRLSAAKDMLVVFGRDFGKLIVPDVAKRKVQFGWENLPDQAELLAASMPCVQYLISRTNIEGKLGHCLLMPELAWHSPTERHSSCSQYCNSSCLCIQELRQPSDSTILPWRSPINPPRNPYSSAAVIFGNPKLFHESLNKRFPSGGATDRDRESVNKVVDGKQ